jgi:hypothetical protein
MRKTPNGTDVIRNVTTGTRLRWLGSDTTRNSSEARKNTELMTRIMIVDADTSLVTNQLMLQ